MRLYSSETERALYIRRSAQQWNASGLIDERQLHSILELSPCPVVQAGRFLRFLLFGFALVVVNPFFALTLLSVADSAVEAVALIYAGCLYIGAEFVVKRWKFYHHGVEEALALSAAGYLVVGVSLLRWDAMILCSVAAISGLWLYYRFSYIYAALGSLFFLCAIPCIQMQGELETRFFLFVILTGVFGSILRWFPKAMYEYEHRQAAKALGSFYYI